MQLQAILAQSRAAKEELSRHAAALDASAAAAARTCASLLVDDLNEEVKQVYDTQRVLERESQLLQQELSTLTTELTSWTRTTQELLEALKHVGDVENYVTVLRREAAVLDRVLGQVAAAQAADQATATGTVATATATATDQAAEQETDLDTRQAAIAAADHQRSGPAPQHAGVTGGARGTGGAAPAQPPATPAAGGGAIPGQPCSAIEAGRPAATGAAAGGTAAAGGQQQQQQQQQSPPCLTSPCPAEHPGSTSVMHHHVCDGPSGHEEPRSSAGGGEGTSRGPLTPHELRQLLEAVQEAVQRTRPPLARACSCPQLLADLAALLCGLRAVIMLDYAPTATPRSLATVMAPLLQRRPGLQVCILHLHGCCYLADAAALQQQLAALAAQPHTWPCVVSCESGQPRALPQGDQRLRQLEQQLQTLASVVSGAGGVAGAGAGSGGSSCSNSSRVPRVIDLEQQPGLPAMPTLNGLLLGYPVVYFVTSQADAAAASRVLSGARLHLHRIVARCGVLAGARLAARGAQGSGVAGEVVVLKAFTVPDSVLDDVDAAVGVRVRELVQTLQARAAAHASCWQEGVQLTVEVVGPRAVCL